MWLMQKIPVQIGLLNANPSKNYRIHRYRILPTIGKAGNVVLLYIGKLVPQESFGKLAANLNIYWSLFLTFEYSDKNLLPTYLNFYADRYPDYQD
jgi:hypothetical protein